MLESIVEKVRRLKVKLFTLQIVQKYGEVTGDALKMRFSSQNIITKCYLIMSATISYYFYWFCMVLISYHNTKEEYNSNNHFVFYSQQQNNIQILAIIFTSFAHANTRRAPPTT